LIDIIEKRNEYFKDKGLVTKPNSYNGGVVSLDLTVHAVYGKRSKSCCSVWMTRSITRVSRK